MVALSCASSLDSKRYVSFQEEHQLRPWQKQECRLSRQSARQVVAAVKDNGHLFEEAYEPARAPLVLIQRKPRRLVAETREIVRPQGQLNNRVKVPVGVCHNVVAESNCVIVKWGGEQLEAKRQSVG